MLNDLDYSVKWILAGQLLLAVCCAFYIPWWFMVFKPGQAHDWTAGRAGILLALTAACGLGGLLANVHGNNMTQVSRVLFSNGHAMVAGVICYIMLMALTSLAFKRPVTSELLLITGWAVLELVTVNILYGANVFTIDTAKLYLAIVLAAFVVNMVLYVLYYKVDEWLAYKLAALPLAIDGAVMLAVSAKILI
ncbi:MAG: hypothetical protein PUB39_06855 [Eubacteriales bacterium]|nr:hypothetical protein [Eubacteriales bacterium]